MKISLITNHGSMFGKKVANGLLRKGIKLDDIIIVRQSLRYYQKLFFSVCKNTGITDAAYFSIRRLMAERRERKMIRGRGKGFLDDYSEFGARIWHARGTNSDGTVKILEKLSPDILILGQTGIVKGPLLRIPKVGTLNAHPAVLPFYRGIDCHLWAAYNEEFHKIGASVHWVDERVDTGDIIRTSRYEFIGDETVEELSRRLEDQSASLLADVVRYIAAGDTPPRKRQERAEGRQYFKMPRRTENIVRGRLRKFVKGL